MLILSIVIAVFALLLALTAFVNAGRNGAEIENFRDYAISRHKRAESEVQDVRSDVEEVRSSVNTVSGVVSQDIGDLGRRVHAIEKALSLPVKKCSRCGRVLPLTEFGPDRRKKDGHCSACRECEAARKRAAKNAPKKEEGI